MTYKISRQDWAGELPRTEVLAEAKTLEEAVELKKIFDEIYRGEIVSIDFPE